MEEKKNNKGLVWLIVILIIMVLGLVGYIVYDKVLFDDKTSVNNDNITSTTTQKNIIQVLESELPEKLNTYFTYWNYQEFYDYYFSMDDKNTLINNLESYKTFIKIENNKLIWNINNSWVIDKLIKEDVKYIDINANVESESSILVLTTDNKLYDINFDGFVEEMFNKGLGMDEISTLTDKQYKYFDYKILEFKNTIDNISKKTFCECGCWDSHYLESDNKIYILNNRTITDIDEFFADDDILTIQSQCMDSKVRIGLDGTTNNVFDSEGKKLNVKHYVAVVDEDVNGDIYNIIVDNNNKLYSFTNDNINDKVGFKYLDTVVDFKYNKSDYSYGNITIKLSSGEILNLGQ